MGSKSPQRISFVAFIALSLSHPFLPVPASWLQRVFFSLSLSPSFRFDYSLLLHFSTPSHHSFLPIFLSGTHHLSSVVFLRHPHPSPPLIFTPSIQFRELYWHHKMNFTVSASLSGTFVFLLLILYSFNAAPQNSAAPCTSCTSLGQVSLQH